jgi:hypothetical protein
VVCELERIFRHHRQWAKSRAQPLPHEHPAPDTTIQTNQRPRGPARTGKFSHINLQPLRIMHSWEIIRNTLYEIDPTEDTIQAGFFDEPSLFVAICKNWQMEMEVVWRSDVDPTGQYHMTLFLAPVPSSNSKGEPDENAPLNFAEAKVVFECQTRSRSELVKEMNSIFFPKGFQIYMREQLDKEVAWLNWFTGANTCALR